MKRLASVTPVATTVPAATVYVNPVFGLYGPCCDVGGVRPFYRGYGAYHGVVRGGFAHGAVRAQGRRR
jgi:hypothetical protein